MKEIEKKYIEMYLNVKVDSDNIKRYLIKDLKLNKRKVKDALFKARIMALKDEKKRKFIAYHEGIMQ